MKTGLIQIIILALLIAGATATPATAAERQPENTPSFQSFSLLMKRNIFDPRRRPGYVTTTTVAAPPPIERIGLQGVLLERGEGLAFFEGSSPEYNATLKLGGIIAGHQVVEIRTDGVVMARDSKTFDFPFSCQLIRKIKSDWEMTTSTEQVYSAPSESFSSRDDRRSFSRDRGSSDGGGRSSYSSSDRGSRSDRYGSRGDRSGSRSDRYGSGGSSRDSGGGSGSQQMGAPTPAPTPMPPGAQDDLMRRLMERRKKETGQ